MEKKVKKDNAVFVVILYILAAVFLIYGIYMIYTSILYVLNYNNYGTVSTSSIVQYVVSSCSLYIGLSILFFTGAKILSSLRNVLPAGKITEEPAAAPEVEAVSDENTSSGPDESTSSDSEYENLSTDTIKDIFENK